MSILAALIRPFWLPGLHSISGKTTSSLSDWCIAQEYQSYHPLQVLPQASRIDRFTLTVAEPKLLLEAYASDCNRVSTASFETIQSIVRIPDLPRSTAWLVVKYYYAAFFSAHTILRMLGVGTLYMESVQATAINQIIDLYGMANGLKVSGGYYRCTYEIQKKELIFLRQDSDKGGSHQFLWTTFFQEMRNLSGKILAMPGIKADQQQASTKLDELCDVLCSKGNMNGGWLTNHRNRVNYKLELGAWFPYAGMTKSNSDKLFAPRRLHTEDPMSFVLTSKSSDEQARFVNTCAFIISLARLLIVDMANRHPENKSFHKFGAIAFLNLINK